MEKQLAQMKRAVDGAQEERGTPKKPRLSSLEKCCEQACGRPIEGAGALCVGADCQGVRAAAIYLYETQ
ncbi:hypothetical protein HNP46_003696 [Pseudomonas nitritireducens]|uniref:Uncharacterized protein n=1 Tax=Pseudomonas nitroreducens TaxID=46680 RepID=A0A7W7KL79_PSENT|nr:hypothetical protein [Pseudomonas nitritireducens]MBB4864824.1 hypothetical protein [Pseudomonas nitritireducens]